MKNINNLFRFIHRRRHAAGFGVHSPFAFDLILDTIHTPHSYYIYSENRRFISGVGLSKEIDIQFAELLFRLVNRFNSKEILEIGSGIGVNTLYLSAHSKQTSIICVEKEENNREKAQSLLGHKIENIIFSNVLPTKQKSFDAIIWDLQQYPVAKKEDPIDRINEIVKDEGLVVLYQINKNKKSKEAWKRVCNLDTLTMSFDLGRIGIGFFRKSLPQINYDVHF